MTKKQATTPKSATSTVSARVAKPKAPRVTSSKHKKATAAEPIVIIEEAEQVAVMTPAMDANPLDTISRLAYGYWEARGCQYGDPLVDWVRAEEAYRQSLL